MKKKKTKQTVRDVGVSESVEVLDSFYGISRAERRVLEAMRGRLKHLAYSQEI